jgi:branched-chain amino acid transport system substrate-binding protein
MKNKFWPCAAAAVVLALGAAACGNANAGEAGSASTITVGVLAPFSGGYEQTGAETLNAVKVAVNEVNAAGGIKALDGAKLRIVTADSTTDDETQAATGAAQLLQDKPDFIIGPPISTVLLPASTVTERAQVPMCTGAFADQITQRGYKYIFQVSPTDTEIGDYAVTAFKTVVNLIHPKGRNAAVFYDSNPANAGVVTFADAMARQTSFHVTLNDEFSDDATNLEPVAAKIKAANPDILLPDATVPELEQILGSLSSLGVSNVPMFWPDGGSSTFESYVKDLGHFVNGQFVVSTFDYDMKLPSAQARLLAQANADYTKLTHLPFMSELAGAAYVCTNDFVQAIEKAKSDSASAIRSAMLDTDFDSGPGSLMPPGKVQFNQAGRNIDAVPVVGEWCHGLLQTVAPAKLAAVTAASPKDCGA